MDKCHLDTKWPNDTEYSVAIRRYQSDTCKELWTCIQCKCQSDEKTVIYYIYSKENKYNLSRVLNVL